MITIITSHFAMAQVMNKKQLGFLLDDSHILPLVSHFPVDTTYLVELIGVHQLQVYLHFSCDFHFLMDRTSESVRNAQARNHTFRKFVINLHVHISQKETIVIKIAEKNCKCNRPYTRSILSAQIQLYTKF